MRVWGRACSRLASLAIVAVAGLGAGGGAVAGPGGSGGAGAGAAVEPSAVIAGLVARYSFDATAPDGSVLDDSGHGHTLTPSGLHGGKVKVQEHTHGHAVRFPTRCTGKKCPHAVLQTPNAVDLDPGTGPIRFGATIEIMKKQTSSGQNIVQKGYSATGSQYKLQVDGAKGDPSCVLADDTVRGIDVAKSDISVADGKWHRLECRRSGPDLTLLIDDVVHGHATVPATLSVTNTVPLSIGGKGDGSDNDQFHGTLDDVWIAVGAQA